MATQRSSDRRSQFVALGLMYFAQGLPSGLAFNALGVLIRDGGHSVSDVSLTGLAFLPWALKFLWAGPIENWCARRSHAYVVGATQWLAIVLCLLLANFPPSTELYLCVAGAVALNLVCATQDIVTNAYAVARMRGRTAGAANAIQVSAFIGGMLAGGGGLLVVYQHWGWAVAMRGLAGLMLLLYLPLLLGRRWRQPPATAAEGDPAPGPEGRVRLRDLREHRDLGWALLIAILFKCAGTAVATLLQPWLIDHGMSVAQAGGLQVSNLVASAVGGVVIGIPLIRWLGDRGAVLASLAGATLLLGTAWGLQAAQVSDVRVIFAAFAVQSLAEGAMYVTVWALFMNWASPRRPGTDYTVMQCCESLSNAAAAAVIGGLGQALGYRYAFGLAWAAALVALLLIALGLRRLEGAVR
ncbi:MFS transporter [Achromobacter insuavis]|uniref:MFS transporter n=1 Tax=Achromobacter insuavis TaxID=1287735 RepID=UPI001F13B72D|nr:MFS transporter [Achromobacter insuavis]